MITDIIAMIARRNTIMYKYNIYIGMFDKDTKQQELSNAEFLNTVRKVLRLNKIDNYTIYKGKGHYKSDSMIVCEPTIIVEIIDEMNMYILNRLDCIKWSLIKDLNQEDILITRQEVEVL